MEINCYFSIPNLVLGGLFVFVLAYFSVLSWKPSTKLSKLKRPPEPAAAWPIVGHLPQLMGTEPDKLFHITLAAMADKYGPVFTIRMGVHTALIVSSWEAAKECFTINDKVFASRPRQVAIRHMGYDSAMFGFAPYSHYWRRIRKVLKRELLSHTRIESLSHVWASEINMSLRELYRFWTENNNGDVGGLVKVEMKQWFSDLTLNLSFMMAVGKRNFGANEEVDDARYKESARIIKNFFRLVDAFVPSDALPFLRWLDLGGYEKEMKKTGNELDALMQECLEEHKTKRKTLINGGYYGKPTNAAEKDWMDVMLSVLYDNPKLSDYYDADIVNKYTCLVRSYPGVADTNMVILVWALSSLVNNQIVLKKVHDELDIHVGKDRKVDKSDIKNLVYLQAVMKETLRLYSGPLSGFLVSSEDCTIASYHIPAGTQLLFNPDRFISGGKHVDSDVIGQNFEFIPFGSGRRSCPAISLALQMLPLTLARLIHGFEFKTPTDAPIDMTGSAGLRNIKATPLEVLVTPRLAFKLYR
ncbi:hypothetical protein C5167_027303 [Papaver somniferum]|nr:hypothetical protein C5167_027303 [Papaver somniferum]